MKKEGSLKIILATLVIILLCIVSLGGIYAKDRNIMKNVLPNYILGMDLDTNTIIKLDVVKNEENSSENPQEENNVTEENSESNNNVEDSEQTKNSTEKNNSENGQVQNIYTVENFEQCKKIIEKRLKNAEINQYTLRLDEQSGTIIMEVPDDVSNETLQNIFVVGKTEIKISENNEVIGDHNSISNITTAIDDSYVNYGIGSFVKLDIEFTKDAIKKFKELKNNYVVPTNEEGNQTENNIVITIDGSTICSMTETEFLETAVKGSLPLKLGDYTNDKATLNNTLKEADSIKNLVKSGNLPITYSVNYTNDIHSNINKIGIISVFAVILVIMLVYLVLKYKLNGIFAELSILGFGTLLLLVMRYTNVEITISSIVSIAVILIVQFIYLAKLLSNGKITSKMFNEETVKFTKMLIPAFIMSVVIAFANILEISGFGMILFWGIILFEIFNNIITRAILTNVKNK